jgi:hypothetical protein
MDAFGWVRVTKVDVNRGFGLYGIYAPGIVRTHLSDDEAVAKMGHPAVVTTRHHLVSGSRVGGFRAWG